QAGAHGRTETSLPDYLVLHIIRDGGSGAAPACHARHEDRERGLAERLDELRVARVVAADALDDAGIAARGLGGRCLDVADGNVARVLRGDARALAEPAKQATHGAAGHRAGADRGEDLVQKSRARVRI